MEDFTKEPVVAQDDPAKLGEHVASPPTEPVPAQQEQEPPPENIPYGRFQSVNQQKNEFKAKSETQERQIEMLTTQLLKQQAPAPIQTQQAPKQVELPREPNPDDFPDGTLDREYLRSVNAYDYGMNELKRDADNKVAQQTASYNANFQQHQLRAANFLAENPEKSDYYTVAESNPVVNHYPPDMVRAIMASPKSPDIAYHLGKKPADAIRIANSPVPALEIGKLEQKLSAPVAAKKTSMAPAPISPVGGTNAANDLKHDDAKMDYQKRKALRNAHEAAARKAGIYAR